MVAFGFVVGLGALVVMVTNPLVGALSYRTVGGLGRRRPLIKFLQFRRCALPAVYPAGKSITAIRLLVYTAETVLTTAFSGGPYPIVAHAEQQGPVAAVEATEDPALTDPGSPLEHEAGAAADALPAGREFAFHPSCGRPTASHPAVHGMGACPARRPGSRSPPRVVGQHLQLSQSHHQTAAWETQCLAHPAEIEAAPAAFLEPLLQSIRS